LKPTLLGGILETQEWISLREDRGIGWWMDFALESNFGLNAIAQLQRDYNPIVRRDLAGEKLFHNI